MTEQTFATLPAQTVLDVIEYLGGDGHGLYDPAFLTDRDVPDALVARVTTVHKSDGSYKGSIFAPDGSVIEETRAVYSLDLYRAINRDLGLPGSSMLGRGFEARQLHGQIEAALNERKNDGGDER